MGARTHIGAKHKMFRLKVILVLFCTYITFSQNRKPKIVFSQNAIKVQLPHFLSRTEALEPSSCIVRNLLCILTNFDIQV